MGRSEDSYPIARRETIAETPNLRVRLLMLGEGQCVPWHYHNNITDTFFCMEGPMQVKTRNPEAVHVLEPGGTLSVQPGIPHIVSPVSTSGRVNSWSYRGSEPTISCRSRTESLAGRSVPGEFIYR